jgi:hypothetical protein
MFVGVSCSSGHHDEPPFRSRYEGLFRLVDRNGLA